MVVATVGEGGCRSLHGNPDRLCWRRALLVPGTGDEGKAYSRQLFGSLGVIAAGSVYATVAIAAGGARHARRAWRWNAPLGPRKRNRIHEENAVRRRLVRVVAGWSVPGMGPAPRMMPMPGWQMVQVRRAKHPGTACWTSWGLN